MEDKTRQNENIFNPVVTVAFVGHIAYCNGQGLYTDLKLLKGHNKVFYVQNWF